MTHKKITPKQEALLHGLNYREYPTIQELFAANVGNNFDIIKEYKDYFQATT